LTNDTVISFEEGIFGPSLLLDIRQRIFVVFTDVSGQPIGFVFKGIAFQEECQATGGYDIL
jgi:hypothetical protein